MSASTDEADKAITSISRPEMTRSMTAEVAKDALNTVVDAINSSVNGLIITDLEAVFTCSCSCDNRKRKGSFSIAELATILNAPGLKGMNQGLDTC